jgi:hypothetical protein
MFRGQPIGFLLIALTLAACAGPRAAGTPTAPSAVTLVSATATRTAPPPTPAPPTAIPSPTPEPPCTNNLRYVEDLSVPDGTQFLAGQTLVKKWRVENTGTCDWGPDYRLVLTEGQAMGAATEVALYPARAGALAVLEIPMKAPPNLGEYVGKWQARDAAGQLFGGVVFIKINVVPLPAP